jgi:DNA processing protein
MEIKVIIPNSFPPLLKEIPDPPSKLFVKGELPPTDKITIAIVGTRKASEIGLKTARDFARELSLRGIVIVSGLALGIDSAAHQGALEGGSATIAVLGNGLDKIYPAQNEKLAQRIITQGGAMVSEYEPGTPSYKENFIRRNRIISGLSLGVVIIEAPFKSGALATASFAASQGREVFVVPGPINHPNYAGSHSLLRDGARLVTSPLEVIEDLKLNLSCLKQPIKNSKAISPIKLSQEENLIFTKIKEQSLPLPVDKIIKLTRLSPQTVNQALTSLILKGLVQEVGGGYTVE